MSTLRVDNLQASDGLSPAFDTAGIAKVRLLYDQITPAVDESANVASVTDSATGSWIINFTNALATTAYQVLAQTPVNTHGGYGSHVAQSGATAGASASKTASAIQMESDTDSGTAWDLPESSVTIHGDLA